MLQWLEITTLLAYRSLHSLSQQNYLVFMIFFELWLILHYAGKLKLFKLQQRTDLANLKSEIFSSAQVSILEQAMLYDRELRKLQHNVGELRHVVDNIKQMVLPLSPDPVDPVGHPSYPSHPMNPALTQPPPHDIISMLADSKRRNLRRICIRGRGWVNARKVQHELGLNDSELERYESEH